MLVPTPNHPSQWLPKEYLVKTDILIVTYFHKLEKSHLENLKFIEEKKWLCVKPKWKTRRVDSWISIYRSHIRLIYVHKLSVLFKRCSIQFPYSLHTHYAEWRSTLLTHGDFSQGPAWLFSLLTTEAGGWYHIPTMASSFYWELWLALCLGVFFYFLLFSYGAYWHLALSFLSFPAVSSDGTKTLVSFVMFSVLKKKHMGTLEFQVSFVY